MFTSINNTTSHLVCIQMCVEVYVYFWLLVNFRIHTLQTKSRDTENNNYAYHSALLVTSLAPPSASPCSAWAHQSRSSGCHSQNTSCAHDITTFTALPRNITLINNLYLHTKREPGNDITSNLRREHVNKRSITSNSEVRCRWRTVDHLSLHDVTSNDR